MFKHYKNGVTGLGEAQRKRSECILIPPQTINKSLSYNGLYRNLIKKKKNQKKKNQLMAIFAGLNLSWVYVSASRIFSDKSLSLKYEKYNANISNNSTSIFFHKKILINILKDTWKRRPPIEYKKKRKYYKKKIQKY